MLWSHRRQGGAWIEAASRSWLQLHVRRLPHEIECRGIEASPHENAVGVSSRKKRPARSRAPLDPGRAQIVVRPASCTAGSLEQAGWALFGSLTPSDGESLDPGARRWGPLPTPRHRTRQRSRTRCFAKPVVAARCPLSESLSVVRDLRESPARCATNCATRRLNVGLLFQRLALVLSGPCNGCQVGKPESNA